MIKRLFTTLLLLIVASSLATAFQSAYSLEDGSSFTIKTVQDQEISQMIMGQANLITTSNTSSEKFDVIGVTNNEFTIKITTLAQLTEMSAQGMTQVMDSEDPSTGGGLFAALKNTSYEFTMDKFGNILSVTGLEAVRDSIIATMEGNPQAAAQIESLMSESAVTTNLTMRFSIFNAEGNDSWTTTKEVDMNSMPVTYSTAYTLSDGKVLANSDISINTTTTQMGMQVKMDLSGEQEAVFNLDSVTGLPVESNSSNTLKGTANAQGMSIPMTISSETTTTITKN